MKSILSFFIIFQLILSTKAYSAAAYTLSAGALQTSLLIIGPSLLVQTGIAKIRSKEVVPREYDLTITIFTILGIIFLNKYENIHFKKLDSVRQNPSKIQEFNNHIEI